MTDKMSARILIADDSEVVREVIRLLLEKCADVEICGEASNGREAIEKAMVLQPDVIILDVAMPEMNGIEAASVLKKRLPGAKTIVFTMYGEYVQTVAGAAGVDVLVAKADGMSPLVDAINGIVKPTAKPATNKASAP